MSAQSKTSSLEIWMKQVCTTHTRRAAYGAHQGTQRRLPCRLAKEPLGQGWGVLRSTKEHGRESRQAQHAQHIQRACN